MSHDISRLFRQAIELNNDAQQKLLQGLDEKTRDEVEALLRADQETGFMAQPVGLDDYTQTEIGDSDVVEHSGLEDAEAEDTPRQIGPFRILQQIGRGGMGVVYAAQQTKPVKRRVALKVIRTATPTREVLGRFEAERQAVALMDHQNIARVYDAGITEDGRPWFAMELVNGVSITQYCDKNRLTPDERMELFVQACRAIQHAHQKGVVHRDIKPSNVMVTQYDGRPVVKVIDFGLAKALQANLLSEQTLFTQHGQVMGTLEYMSPEQAEMNAIDIDTRSDVYSLGVILYELLTGTTPIGRARLKQEAFDRILRMIREEEAPRPSDRLSESRDQLIGISEQRQVTPKKLSGILKGDLDWIALKALAKDRSKRYDGPASLAEDVLRYLSGEEIEARPPSWRYRLSRTSFRVNRKLLILLFTIPWIAVLLLFIQGSRIKVRQDELDGLHQDWQLLQKEIREKGAAAESQEPVRKP